MKRVLTAVLPSMSVCVLILCVLGALTLQMSDGAEAVPNSWTVVGSMNAIRVGHTATLLPSGKVLVAGGCIASPCGAMALNSAELYDPGTRTWSYTASMSSARYYHTATLLADGTVLIAGGTTDTADSVPAAEIYHPNSGTWSSGGTMNTGRWFSLPDAQLLPNGKVLLAGGTGTPGILSSAELYDPATNTWSYTGAMSTARRYHGMALLSNNTVLVAGGYNGTNLSSSEIYDIASGSWSAGPAMSEIHYGHILTTLQNGGVLTTGGINGCNPGCPYTFNPTADLYNGSWSAGGALVNPRDAHAATLLADGRVLLTGGSDSLGWHYLNSAEIYDPASNMSSATGNLHTARGFHTATLLPDGSVLVSGGCVSDGSACSVGTSSAELYNAPALSVGGIAEQPNLAALPSAAASSNRNYSMYIRGVAGAVLVILGVGAWATWRRPRVSS